MPMLDAYIPDEALAPEAERQLLSQLTDILLKQEGADPTDPAARSIAKLWVHRPHTLVVAGEPPDFPHYRIFASVPEGQFDDDRRQAMVAAVTDAVLDAEQGRYPRDPARVWVFAFEVPDGTWGGRGQIHRLADIAAFVLGDAEKGRAYAESRLAQRTGRQVVTAAPGS
jgi:phenylpyruvate tautomerase PptA (4-oxalocrotonate tautomerase family)